MHKRNHKNHQNHHLWRSSADLPIKICGTQVHDWFVYKFSGFLGSVGHRVKIHKITTATGKERGHLEVKDYSVWTIKFTLLDNSRTQQGQMVILNLMVL
jgi:hypothetical protein